MVSAAPFWFTMLVQFVVAMVATISFGITFQVGRRHYWTCGFVGAVGWTIYIACTTLGGMTAPMATLIATLPLAALSRFFAIRHKAPITVFLLTGIFPLVPGAGIYYTAYYFLRNDRALCTSKGIETLKVAVFDMPTLYLIQTFNDMGYYKDNGANVEFTYFSVYSDAISAYDPGNADGNYLCGRRGCYTCCKQNWHQSNRCYRYFKRT